MPRVTPPQANAPGASSLPRHGSRPGAQATPPKRGATAFVCSCLSGTKMAPTFTWVGLTVLRRTGLCSFMWTPVGDRQLRTFRALFQVVLASGEGNGTAGSRTAAASTQQGSAATIRVDCSSPSRIPSEAPQCPLAVPPNPTKNASVLHQTAVRTSGWGMACASGGIGLGGPPVPLDISLAAVWP